MLGVARGVEGGGRTVRKRQLQKLRARLVRGCRIADECGERARRRVANRLGRQKKGTGGLGGRPLARAGGQRRLARQGQTRGGRTERERCRRVGSVGPGVIQAQHTRRSGRAAERIRLASEILTFGVLRQATPAAPSNPRAQPSGAAAFGAGKPGSQKARQSGCE